MRIVAVDWSGRVAGERQAIWLAEVVDGALARLESGRTREEIAAHLVELAGEDAELVVGLDFAFSLPRWYLDELEVRLPGHEERDDLGEGVVVVHDEDAHTAGGGGGDDTSLDALLYGFP